MIKEKYKGVAPHRYGYIFWDIKIYYTRQYDKMPPNNTVLRNYAFYVCDKLGWFVEERLEECLNNDFYSGSNVIKSDITYQIPSKDIKIKSSCDFVDSPNKYKKIDIYAEITDDDEV